MEARGLRAAVANDVAPELAPRRLDALVDVALGRLDGLGDFGADRLALRPVQHVQALQAELRALPHLLRADQVPGQAVAVLLDADLEVQLGVDATGVVAPQVDVDARAPRDRSADAVGDGLLGRDVPDAVHAGNEDPVAGEELVVLLEPAREVAQELPALLAEAHGQVVPEPADSHIVVEQTLSGDRLQQVQQHFPFAEAVQEQRDRAQVQAEGPQPQQMALQPLQLTHQHADVLAPAGDLHAEHLLDRLDIDHVVRHGAQIVEAVGEGDYLRVRAVLADLLQGAVQVADDRVALDDELTVERQHEPKHPVRARVLGAHVQEQLFGSEARCGGHGVLRAYFSSCLGSGVRYGWSGMT